MVHPLVERATSSLLIGPDWAMNLEICNVCNHDPSQAKDVVKTIKKRVRSKNPKVQLLALTLLETLMNNCGDIVHMFVAEKDLPYEIIKILKKKPDSQVREKILTMIDNWKTKFGGPMGKYPQYLAAYHELLRLGHVFPRRAEMSNPIFKSPHTQQMTSLSKNRGKNNTNEAGSSAEDEFPTLSLTEIQNARGVMGVLAEMLLASNPDNLEGLKQEVFIDLVEQCRKYKHRVVHLVNSTADESLLCQGLALNDDLQRLLAKHEALSAAARSKESEPHSPLFNVDAPLIDTGEEKPNEGSTVSDAFNTELLLPAPPETSDQSSTPATNVDLLSGDGKESPEENSPALVPVRPPQPSTPVSAQKNSLSLVVSIPQSIPSLNSGGQMYPWSPRSISSVPMLREPIYSQGPGSPWSPHMVEQQQQQQNSPAYGGQNTLALPPPPWEIQLDSSNQNQQVHVTVTQVVINQSPPQSPSAITNNQSNRNVRPPEYYHQQQPFPHYYEMPAAQYPPHLLQTETMGGYNCMYPGHGQIYDYNHPNTQFLEGGKSMEVLPVTAPRKRTDDKLFGDLVDLSKFKPGRTNGSM